MLTYRLVSMTSAIPAPARRRRREETRRLLLDAALSVFARNGFERATVDEIVREAGFSKGAFYVHFESKEDLFWEMLQERIDAQQETIRAALDPDDSVVNNERRLLEAIFKVQHADSVWPAMFMEFAAHAARNEKVRERLGAMYERWHRFTVDMLTEAKKLGKVRQDLDVAFAASVLIAVLEGSMIQSRVAPESIRLDRQLDKLSELLAGWLEG